ncbi:MAG: hypothetical protein KBC36_12295 [Spirochaetia bacterium]|nr:hypothetical protein [Spirochaetia bacterium]
MKRSVALRFVTGVLVMGTLLVVVASLQSCASNPVAPRPEARLVHAGEEPAALLAALREAFPQFSWKASTVEAWKVEANGQLLVVSVIRDAAEAKSFAALYRDPPLPDLGALQRDGVAWRRLLSRVRSGHALEVAFYAAPGEVPPGLLEAVAAEWNANRRRIEPPSSIVL